MTDGRGPTRGAVILFIAGVIATVLCVAAGTAFAVYDGQRTTTAANRQWCTVLTLLTSRPVPEPSRSARHPSRVAAYQLYEDFLTLRKRFGCG